MKTQEELKKEAALKAVDFVKSGMIVGLGTGSTTKYAVEEIGRKLREGELSNIIGIPTSEATAELANSLNIPLGKLEEYPHIDLTIDGADEVDDNLNLIKGGGGALLREKIVAQASEKEIIIVDETKLSTHLGEKWALPIEVVKMAVTTESEFLKSIGGTPSLRGGSSSPFVTDEGNYILDTNFGIIENPVELSKKLNERAGIVEHGLFINLCSQLVIASKDGIILKEKE